MDETRAGCKGDPRFIRDEQSPLDEAEMSALCDACPLRTLCAAAVGAMTVKGGYWAGTQYGRSNGRTRKDDECTENNNGPTAALRRMGLTVTAWTANETRTIAAGR